MMKKLSKIALLAAASAFMLAVFPACGDDEEDDDPKATLALVGDGGAVELETGKAVPVTATVAVENDTFSENAKKIPQGETISKEYFELKAGENVDVSEAKVEAWTSKTVAKISFTVTAKEGATAGTISAEIKPGTLTSNATLTAEGNIAYTIKASYKQDDEQNNVEGDSPKPDDGDDKQDGSGTYTGWTWTVADYVSSTSSTKFGEEKSCGKITAGKNVKETSTGVGISGTLSEGVNGYFQVSAGADGSVWFTAPAGTKQIVVCAKLDKTTKQIVLRTNATSTTDYKDLGTVTGAEGDNYKDHVFTVNITEDTVVYAGTFSTGVSANMKAIKVSE